jgi:hypothetical protein
MAPQLKIAPKKLYFSKKKKTFFCSNIPLHNATSSADIPGKKMLLNYFFSSSLPVREIG